MKTRAWILCVFSVAIGSLGEGQAEPPGGDIGTDHLIVVDRVSPDGRWVIACQGRVDTDGDGEVESHFGHHGDPLGDALDPYLIQGVGPGERFSEFVCTDAVGRHVVMVKDGRLWLLDTVAGTREDLSAKGADARDYEFRFGPHRAANIVGKRLRYIRNTGQSSVVVVRDLDTKKEARIEPGPGLFWRARLDRDGAWVLVDVVSKDTSGDGRLEWPNVVTTLAPRRCRGPWDAYSNLATTGDRPERRYAPASGGTAEADESVLFVVGAYKLQRTDTKALVLTGVDGESRQIAPADDAARVIRAAADPLRILVIATMGARARQVRFVTADGIVRVGKRTFSPPEKDRRVAPVMLARIGEHHHFDLETGLLHRMPGMALARSGPRVLVRRDGRLAIRDLDAGREITLAFGDDRSRLRRNGARVAISPRPTASKSSARGHVLDLSTGRVSGTFDGEALAVDATGRVLLPASRDVRRRTLRGPLRWVTPTPPK